MLRILAIAAAFLTVTMGLLLVQPRSDDADQADAAALVPAQVARAETNLTDLTTPVAPVVAAPAPATESPGSQESEAMTNSVLAGLGVQPAAPAPAPADDAALLSLTSSLLAELGVKPTAATSAPQQDNALRGLTSSVLAGLNATQTDTPAHVSMETLIVQALAQGQSDSYIDALLNEAADRGQVQVPGALRTSEGKVDTTTLLAALVRKSTGKAPEAVSPAVIAGGEGVEVRVIQRAGKTVQYNFYTVQTGDSLGSIAQKFYGDAGQYSTIFNANRQFLSSPDRIRVGQRLSIPALTST
ncbi:MAG: hypothetical protein CSA70_03050 [Rhodobacterales bacterium]|nr:MAG: hypothetical protein CSA70_03050 [Rhodobacterales bacterium]